MLAFWLTVCPCGLRHTYLVSATAMDCSSPTRGGVQVCACLLDYVMPTKIKKGKESNPKG